MTTELTPKQEAAKLRGLAIARGLDALGEELTGYEEEGILKAFGHRWSDQELDVQSTLRALVFVLKKREGMNHDDAMKAVMEMKARDVQEVVIGYDDDEVNPDQPVTELGKGDGPIAVQLVN